MRRAQTQYNHDAAHTHIQNSVHRTINRQPLRVIVLYSINSCWLVCALSHIWLYSFLLDCKSSLQLNCCSIRIIFACSWAYTNRSQAYNSHAEFIHILKSFRKCSMSPYTNTYTRTRVVSNSDVRSVAICNEWKANKRQKKNETKKAKNKNGPGELLEIGVRICVCVRVCLSCFGTWSRKRHSKPVHHTRYTIAIEQLTMTIFMQEMDFISRCTSTSTKNHQPSWYR